MMLGRPIFIGGLMKSGTSLLRKLLSRHTRLFGGLETFWFSHDLAEAWRDPSTQRATWLRAFYDISEKDYVAMIERSGTGAELFGRVMSSCARRHGKQRWIEKTPDNVLHLAAIFRGWPDAQVIHVVRDPRDVWASWKNNQKLSLHEMIRQAQNVYVSVVDRSGAAAPIDAYLEVKYEVLVSQTREVLQDSLSFLNEPWEDGLEAYEGDDADHQKVLAVTGKDSATARSLARPVFQSSVGQWRRVLEAHEVERIERELEAPMRAWGYR